MARSFCEQLLNEARSLDVYGFLCPETILEMDEK